MELRNPRANDNASISAKKGPHQDVAKNFAYYQKIMRKIQIIESLQINVSEDFDGPIFCCFSYKEGIHERSFAYPLSFHQEHGKFRQELCNCLNFFKGKSLLERTDKPAKPTDWEVLFSKR